MNHMINDAIKCYIKLYVNDKILNTVLKQKILIYNLF